MENILARGGDITVDLSLNLFVAVKQRDVSIPQRDTQE